MALIFRAIQLMSHANGSEEAAPWIVSIAVIIVLVFWMLQTYSGYLQKMSAQLLRNRPLLDGWRASDANSIEAFFMKRPSGEWGSTGGNTPDLSGGLTMPAGNNGGLAAKELLCQVLALLYSCVGSAQRAKAESEEQHAVYQMVITNAALAAGEGDAFLTLVSAGLEGPACIHLRALGELATRMVICFRRHDLALKFYKTWPAAWERLIKMQRSEIEFDEQCDKSAKDMRQLERSSELKEARDSIAAEIHLINEVESTMWSKRPTGIFMRLSRFP